MLTKRIIPCLDVEKGFVVKGKNFSSLKYAGDAVDLAKKYNDAGADEIVFLDITASYDKRETIFDLVEKVAENIFIPFTVGGGIKDDNDVVKLLDAGADKVSINTSAFRNPDLINSVSARFGSQCIVVAIDAKNNDGFYEVYVEGGRKRTGIDAVSWAKKAEKFGAGEILLTSIDYDGTNKGFDLKLTKLISESVNIPVIASGGAGNLNCFLEVFNKGKADAALAASIFHYDFYAIEDVKSYLKLNGVEVRL